MLARCADGDDAVWARHLELEVSVVGDDHELGVAWSPQNCVVGPWEPDHVEGEDLPSKVVGGPKADTQVNLPEGMGAMFGTTPWNGDASFLSRDLLIPMRAKVSA